MCNPSERAMLSPVSARRMQALVERRMTRPVLASSGRTIVSARKRPPCSFMRFPTSDRMSLTSASMSAQRRTTRPIIEKFVGPGYDIASSSRTELLEASFRDDLNSLGEFVGQSAKGNCFGRLQIAD